MPILIQKGSDSFTITNPAIPQKIRIGKLGDTTITEVSAAVVIVKIAKMLPIKMPQKIKIDERWSRNK